MVIVGATPSLEKTLRPWGERPCTASRAVHARSSERRSSSRSGDLAIMLNRRGDVRGRAGDPHATRSVRLALSDTDASQATSVGFATASAKNYEDRSGAATDGAHEDGARPAWRPVAAEAAAAKISSQGSLYGARPDTYQVPGPRAAPNKRARWSIRTQTHQTTSARPAIAARTRRSSTRVRTRGLRTQ